MKRNQVVCPTVYNNNCHYYTELHDSWAISIFSLQASTPVTLAPNLAEQWNIISPEKKIMSIGNRIRLINNNF